MDTSNSILDALMLQVEAESGTPTQPSPHTPGPLISEVPAGEEQREISHGTRLTENTTNHTADHGSMDIDSTVAPTQVLNDNYGATQPDQIDHLGSHDTLTSTTAVTETIVHQPSEIKPDDIDKDVVSMETGSVAGKEEGNNMSAESNQHTAEPPSIRTNAASEDSNTQVPEDMSAISDASALNVDAIPPDNTIIPGLSTEGAEWEIDSSPYESSDSDSSSDTTSDDDSDDDDADGDYAMLDPEEAARILMQGDGGSDDEGGKSKDKSGGAGALRTANEKPEEIVPKPDITITEDMKIEELGNVEFVVENTILIKAKTSGEYQVLETGSLICLKDRSVIGVVADLIGRVEEPRYTVRFTNEKDIVEAGVSEVGTTIFYVPQHSTFVFTQPLKSVKGSDASNFHDEEVGDDEMEFSDDEAEAEHKRQVKLRRQGRTAEIGRGRGGSKFSKGPHRGGRGGQQGPSSRFGPRDLDSPEMNYDDVADGAEDDYTPLQRPDNLSDLLANGPPPLTHPLPPPPSIPGNRGDFGDRSRGHGRGGRGGNRPHRGRGGFNQGNSSTWTRPNNMSYQPNTNAGYPQQTGAVPQAPQLNLPNTPSITPYNVTYPPMSPSPITPLPNSSFNFGGYQPPANFAFPQPPPNFPFPNPNIPGMSMPPMPNFQHQYNPQANLQNLNPGPAPDQGNLQAGPWASNPAFMAEFQRQVEEQRRHQGQGQN
ncbi:hypothetical protein LTR84_000847 [Exophiala bonariae]|uniref:H/ACA ribonucleoprotein complex non-core subunit NAF1 n=1 Tax=Exophiala bonariae TaxID=1690606 RepID=A0AAV9NUH3_9EURO|nr:hypothetical protein LTR84_000847 [Exophiala bonariae]